MKHSTRMFHIMFQCFIPKTLREKNKNTEGAIPKHSGSDIKTQWERSFAPIVFFT